MKISFVGLGKLGCCMAVGMASKGFDVIGIDINEDVVNAINEGRAPHFEPELEQLIKDNKERFTATTDYKEIADTDITFIMVPTPSTIDGGFSTEYVETAALEVGRNIPDDKEYHNVVITSTVVPGSIESKIKPVLEQAFNRKVGKNLGLCHVPEFMAIGTVIYNFLNPEFVIIGESDKRAGDMVEDVYRELLDQIKPTFEKMLNKSLPEDMKSFKFTNIPIHRMGIQNAELTKVSNNAYIAMKMSFANTIAEICEKMPGGNAREVLKALGADTRIGLRYLKPGLAFGGVCFPRDSHAFIFAANKYGTTAHLAQMTDVVNIHQIERMVTTILRALSDAGTNKLTMLGITYKPDTVLVEESAALKIAQKLLKEGIEIKVYDPSFGYDKNNVPIVPNLILVDSVSEALKGNHVCFIATPWNKFQELTLQDFTYNMKSVPIIIDAWGILKNKLYNIVGIDYRELGTYHEKIQ